MSARVNYFKLGLFVMVALAIALAAVLVLGAGVLFRKQILAETYLDESVQGLEVGAAVRYRGVHVGKIKEITFVSRYYQQVAGEDTEGSDERAEGASEKAKGAGAAIRYVLVRFALYPEVFKGRLFSNFGERLRQEVKEQGLRCRLSPQGLTGLLYLEVDYVPPASAASSLRLTWQPDPVIYYIPSVPSTIARMSEAVVTLMDNVDTVLRKLNRLDVTPIIDQTTATLAALRTQIEDAHLGDVRAEAIGLLKNLDATNTQMQDLLKRPEIGALLKGAQDVAATAAAARQAMEGPDSPVQRLLTHAAAASAEITSASARLNSLLGEEDLPEAAVHLRNLLRRLDDIAAQQQDSIQAILENLRQATENLREFSRTARDNPPQLIFGQPPAQPKMEEKR